MLTPQSVSLTLFILLVSCFALTSVFRIDSQTMKREDEQRPNNANKSIINGKVLVLFVLVSLSAMVFLSYFPLVTSSSLNNVLDDGSEDGLLLPIAKEELEEVLKEEQREKNV